MLRTVRCGESKSKRVFETREDRSIHNIFEFGRPLSLSIPVWFSAHDSDLAFVLLRW